MTNKNRSLRMEIKQVSEQGSFEGILATYGNVDLGGDLIEPGAFSKTIREHGPEVKLLWQHDPASVIGTLQLIDGPDALRVKGQIELDPDIPFSMTAYKLLKKNLLSGLSIGYDTIKDSTVGGVRHLKELRLWEGSIVTFPMNEEAGVTSVKNHNGSTSEILSEPGQMEDAICTSLYDVLWASDLTREERVAGSQLALKQFSDAWLLWLPQYLEQVDGNDHLKQSAVELKTRIAHALKLGRRISSSTRSSLKEARGSIQTADSILSALYEEAAVDPEEDDTSAVEAAKQKSEPVTHSAALHLMNSIRALIPTA